MATERNVWMIMSFGADASWEGNTGYSDDIPTRYQFNSFVPNSRRVHTKREYDKALLSTVPP